MLISLQGLSDAADLQIQKGQTALIIQLFCENRACSLFSSTVLPSSAAASARGTGHPPPRYLPVASPGKINIFSLEIWRIDVRQIRVSSSVLSRRNFTACGCTPNAVEN